MPALLALTSGCGGSGDVAPAETSGAVTSPSATTDHDETLRARVDLEAATAEVREVATGLVESGVPGVLVLLGEGPDAQVVAEGVAVRGSEVPPSPDQPSRIASLTKPMVAAAVLRLAERGDLALDDSVAEYLPGLLPDGAQVTISELLSHSSGLPELTEPILGRSEPWSSEKTRRVLGRLEAQESAFSSYTNTNYILLGLVVEEVTGDTLDDALRNLIFEPAGIADAAVLSKLDPDTVIHGYSGPYDETDLVLRTAHAAGGVVASAHDVDRFMVALTDGTLLPEELEAQMTQGKGQSLGTFDDYGLGVATFDTDCGPAHGHSGRLPGYTSEMWWLAGVDRRVVVLINSDADVASGGAYELVHAALCG